MAARRFQHREGAVHIGAKIGFRLLYRRHDVGARRQMENAFDAGARRIDRARIGDVGLDDLELRIAFVLLQIGAPADNKVVEDAHAAPFGDQPVDKMASDKAGAPSHQINHSNLVDRPHWEPSTNSQPSETPYQAP